MKKLWATTRWRIAYLLDRSPRTCWADLVSWVQDGRDGKDYSTGYLSNQGASCRAESLDHRDHECYCGKFRDGRTGKEARA